MPVGVDLLDVRADLSAHGCARGVKRIVRWRRAVVVQAQDHTSEMGVVRLGTAESVISERSRQVRAARQVLQPSAPPCIADEHVQLAVGTEPDHATVVIPLLIVIGGARMPRDCEIVGLPGAQLHDVGVHAQLGSVPREAVDPVAEQWHVGRRRVVRTGAALRPEDIHRRRGREVGMERQAEQASFGVGVDCEVEHRRRLNRAGDDALDLPGSPFEHEEVVRP